MISMLRLLSHAMKTSVTYAVRGSVVAATPRSATMLIIKIPLTGVQSSCTRVTPRAPKEYVF